ncbi:TPA: NINE protein [Serratia marcescens]
MSRKDKLAAALLAIFLGGLGIHKFYLGMKWWGCSTCCSAGRGSRRLSALSKALFICSNRKRNSIRNTILV